MSPEHQKFIEDATGMKLCPRQIMLLDLIEECKPLSLMIGWPSGKRAAREAYESWQKTVKPR